MLCRAGVKEGTPPNRGHRHSAGTTVCPCMSRFAHALSCDGRDFREGDGSPVLSRSIYYQMVHNPYGETVVGNMPASGAS